MFLSIYILCFLGGSGFLGQNIVRLLQERDPMVKEIRIVDLRPYKNRLGKQEKKEE
jgi:nucleoside-diphosphate-sugar epimerase